MRPISRFIRLATGATLAAAAIASHAATVTLSNWTWGNGNNVSVSTPGYNGAAGGFSGTLAGSGVAGLDGSIHTYCVDLSEFFSFGTPYTSYSVVDATAYFGADKWLKLARLVSYVDDNNLYLHTASGKRDDLSTAIQLAIWNIRYDDDLTLSSGLFSSSTTSIANATVAGSGFMGANALLSASANAAVSKQLWVLQSNGQQDQLVWKPAAVPEPASLALAGLGLAAAAAVRRRKAAR